MRKNYCLAFCFLLSNFFALSQNYDRIWVGGFDEFPDNLYEYYEIEYNGWDPIYVNLYDVSPSIMPYSIEATVTALTTFPNWLMLYTNGCRIISDSDVVKNLNPGEVSELACPFDGYMVPQGALFIPVPDKKDRYYLLHMGANFDPVRKLKLSPLYFTEIFANYGLMQQISRNNVLLEGDLGSFHAVRHGNGRDWWVLAPQHGNRVWHTMLAAKDKLDVRAAQPIPGATGGCERHEATALSLDGSMVANWGDCKVSLLRFDRCTGLLFDLREIRTPSHWVPGGGLAFSPNGRYLYATSHSALFRADLQQEPLRFDTLRFAYDPNDISPYSVPGNTFFYMANTPDGKIRIASASRAKYFHVIENPDGTTRDNIGFKAKGFPLPNYSARSIPHFPNYRLFNLKGSPCDTLNIVSDNEASGPHPYPVSLSPNPASDRVWINDNSGEMGMGRQFQLFTAAGQRCFSAQLPPDAAHLLNLPPDLPTGIYFWSLQRTDGAFAGGRLAVMR